MGRTHIYLLFLLGLFVVAKCSSAFSSSSSSSSSSTSSSSSISSATTATARAVAGAGVSSSYTSSTGSSAGTSSSSSASSSTTTSTTEQCTGDNEVYNDCTDDQCGPRTCDELGYPLNCSEPCTPGCVCASGRVRNSNGDCIIKTDCPSCRDDFNATAGCSDCHKNCLTYNKTGVVCSQPCYFNGCTCKEGYVYDINQDACVNPNHCTAQCTGDDEAINDCTKKDQCVARTCDDLGQSLNCSEPCNPGCICASGYVYDVNLKKCVSPDQCSEQCTGDNEVYNDCTDDQCGPRTCDELGYSLDCSEPCTPGCVCASGRVRNSNGDCINKTDCPSCRDDFNATAGCSDCHKNCLTYNKTGVVCSQPCYFNGCTCKEGYVYDNNQDACVNPNQCTAQCTGDDEAINDCTKNDQCVARTCDDLGKSLNCSEPCNPGCICTSGFVYDDNLKKCMSPDQCSDQCAENEEYNDCTSDSCEARSCLELGFPLKCLQPNSSYTCEPGCVCTSGYLKDSDGICVKDTDCPSCGDDPNATGPGCSNYCGNTCKDYFNGQPGACPLFCEENGCECKEGFVYDGNQEKCVLPCDCIICDGINEEYSQCPEGRCVAKTCDELGEPVPCPDLPPDCPSGPGCVCSEGFVRGENGTCILEGDCPPACTGEHEEYSDCPDADCGPKFCHDLGFPVACPDIPEGGCKGGCVCESGYLRDVLGICIDAYQCPDCGGSPNATIGCGAPSHCGHSCSDYTETGKVCPLGCSFNSCKCKDGYVWDENVDKCVAPYDCTPVCATNQTYVLCNVNCKDSYCPEDDGPVPQCSPPYPCPAGCRCSPNYRISVEGKCILASECPPVECTRQKEEWYECPDFRSQDCEDRNQEPTNSVQYCQPGCYCQSDYYKNSEGQCVPAEECD